MKNQSEHNFSIYILFEYIFLFLTILQVNSVVYLQHSRSVGYLWFGMGFLLVVTSLFRLFQNHTNILPLLKIAFVFLIFALLILLVTLTNGHRLKYITLFTVIPLGFLVFFYERMVNKQLNQLLLAFKNIMLVLAIISIVFWIMALVGVPTNMTTTVTWGSNPNLPGYFGIQYLAQGSTKFFGINIIRNTGLFVEAPMYAYTLSIALLISLYVEKDLKVWQIVLFTLTIISTTSTTGAIIGLAALSWYFIFVNKVKNPAVKLLFIGACLFVLFYGIYYLIGNKVSAIWYSSSSVRTNDYYAGFMAWKQHIFKGNGLGNFAVIENYMDYRRILYSNQIGGITGFSNGIMEVLAFGGLLTLSIYVIPTVLACFVSRKMTAFSLLSFTLFCTTVIPFSYLYILILCFLFMKFYEMRINPPELENTSPMKLKQ